MITLPRERIELELPREVVFAMRGMGKPDLVQQTVKTALAVYLFQEQAISLGKAIELSGMGRLQFIELLQTHGIAAYEYTEHDFERDMQAVAAYRLRGNA